MSKYISPFHVKVLAIMISPIVSEETKAYALQLLEETSYQAGVIDALKTQMPKESWFKRLLNNSNRKG